MTAIQLLACAGMIVGVIFTAGNEASGVYGQPVWIFIESQTKSAGRHQGIIRKKKNQGFCAGN